MIALQYDYFISTNAGLYNSAEALEQQTSLFLLHDFATRLGSDG